MAPNVEPYGTYYLAIRVPIIFIIGNVEHFGKINIDYKARAEMWILVLFINFASGTSVLYIILIMPLYT